MGKMLAQTTIRVDNVEWEQWKKVRELFITNSIWFTESTNEGGYNLIESSNKNPYPHLVESGILSEDDAGICEHVIKPDNILIVFN